METIAITGGTGLIGSALRDLLVSNGYSVIIFSRTVKPSIGNVSYAEWDPERSFIDSRAISRADHIIHLAGAGVADKRWSAKRKKEIVSSRVKGGELIAKSLSEIPNGVQTVVSASGIGAYGPDRKTHAAFVESDPFHTDFLGTTCKQWEQSITPVTAAGKRLVILRTGIVLSNDGGAFPEFVRPMKAGIAAILGSGKQVISWVHIDDICRMYLAAIERKNMSGVYNATAPEPVTNRQLVLRTAKTRKRPFIAVHVPAFALRLVLGEMSIEVLKSTTVNSDRIRNAGFHFLYPTFDAALNGLVKVS